MSTIKLQRIQDSTEKSQKREPVTIQPPAILGRGSLLKCPEKKVSRNHAAIDWDDEGISLTANHISPTFVKVNGKTQTLKKGDSIVLKNGDEFGLLPTTFWFRLILDESLFASSTQPNNVKETKPVENVAESISASQEQSNALITNGSQSKEVSKNSEKLNESNEEKLENLNESKSPIKSDSLDDSKQESLLNGDQTQCSNDLPRSTSKSVEYKSDRVRNLPKWMQAISKKSDEDKKESNIKMKVHGQPVKRSLKKDKGNHSDLKNSKIIKNSALHAVSEDELEDNTETNSHLSKNPSTTATSSAKTQDLRSPSKPKTKKSPTKKYTKVSPAKAYHTMSLESDEDMKTESHAVSSDEEVEETKRDNGVSDSSEDDESVISKKRQSCQFGESCFRRNPAHKREYAHPGDDDYVAPMDINSDENDDKPECEFGVDCFRKNPQHKKSFKHTRFPQPRRKAALKAKRKRAKMAEGDSDDSYDYDDPFLNDDSSDDYDPTDSDTDSPVEDDATEQEDTKRLIKEAKKFTKKSF